MQSEPGLGATPSTMCFLWQKHRETEDPEKLSNKVKTNLCRNPLLLYFSKSLRGMLGHPRNARTSEMVQKAKLLKDMRQWAPSVFESVWFSHQNFTLGDGQAAVLIRGPFISPEKRVSVQREMRTCWGKLRSQRRSQVTPMMSQQRKWPEINPGFGFQAWERRSHKRWRI